MVKAERKAVLVVEDDDAIRGMVESILEAEGFLYLSAPNGQIALDILGQEKQRNTVGIGLILLDMKMPIVSGREFLQRRPQGVINIPVIIMSASEKPPPKGTIEGVVGNLCKPFDIDNLLVTVGQYIDLTPSSALETPESMVVACA